MQPDQTRGPGAPVTRSVSQWERALLAQWFASTDRTGMAAIAAAYVSERSQDDPRLRNMIIIAERTKGEVNYLVHRPVGENAWVLSSGHTGEELGRFRTLPEALNTVRPYRSMATDETALLPARLELPLAAAANGR